MAGKRKAESHEVPSQDADPAASVAMVRDPESNPPPHAADVHPDEVENFKAGGWRVKD